MSRLSICSILVLLLIPSVVLAGYQAPPHIDGCQSADGRFVITAELLKTGKLGHGPNEWRVIWKDTKKKIEQEITLEGLTKGQIFAQLFMAPDGETFAMFNHITLYSPGTSNMHGPKGLAHREDSDAWRNHEAFSHRLVIYRKDGSILKELSAADFVQADEWPAIGRMFNRLEWLAEYDDIAWKSAVRYPYAFCRVSPDYTVLELQIKPPKARRQEGPRIVRVSLVDGRIFGPAQWPTDSEKVPTQPSKGLLAFPSPLLPEWRENFVPSLDPVRRAGTLTIDDKTYAMDDPKLEPILQRLSLERKKAKSTTFIGPATRFVSTARLAASTSVELNLIADGYKKADTPGWFTDFE